FVPGHKCSGQLHSIEVICEGDIDNCIDGDDDTYKDCVGEMVLGIQWLATLGDMQCNFKKLIMKFNHKGRQLVLRGINTTHVHWMQGSEGMLKQAELFSIALCVYPVQLCKMESVKSVFAKVEQVLTQFDEVFKVPKDLPPQRSHDHQIPLMPNTPQINVRPYRHPPNQKDAIKEERWHMEDVH
ncbi:hypothetical protein Tco_1224958, partial [Tanacetum coccineum]